MLNEGRKLNEC